MKEIILISLFISLASAQYCIYGNDCYSGCCYNGLCESMSMCTEALQTIWIIFWVLIALDIFVWLVYLCLYFSKRKSTMMRIGIINEKARIAFERAQTMKQQGFQNMETDRTQGPEVIIYK